MHAGMEAGAGMLMNAPAGLRRTMVVLSDGQPNVGLVERRSSSRQFTQTLRPIGVSTLGFGIHHDENVLHRDRDRGLGPLRLRLRSDRSRASISRVLRSRTAASSPNQLAARAAAGRRRRAAARPAGDAASPSAVTASGAASATCSSTSSGSSRSSSRSMSRRRPRVSSPRS